MELELLKDFPKLHCPFVRKTYKINHEDWKRHGTELGLRAPEVYLVTPEINPELSWAFDDNTYAVEKLHGTPLAVEVKNGYLSRIQNRKNPIDFLRVVGKKNGLPPSGRFLEGVLEASDRNYLVNNKVQYGELIGPRMNGNLHLLDKHLWYPFERARTSLRYKSFNKYPKEFWSWSEWFRTALKSILYCRMNDIGLSEMWHECVPFTEGIIIYQDDAERDMPRMAKLRRDMFPWYYWKKIEIYDLEDHWIDYAKENRAGLVKGYIRGDSYVGERED